MKPHDTFLELAATSVDYPLSATERGRLDQHLAWCPACARSAAGFHADALALGDLPGMTLPERRGAEILGAALNPARVAHPMRLVVVAALLGLLLVGTMVAGARLLHHDDDLSVIVPVPSMTAPPDGLPSPSPEPTLVVDRPVGRLAVTHGEGGVDWIEIVEMNGATTRLAEGRDPAWLSNDTIVISCAYPDSTTGICALDARTPGSRQALLAGADRPAPAPDGSRIAVHRGMTDVGETWTMAADGSDVRLLHSGAFLRWSPDGAWLAGQPESATYEVAIVGADGQGYRVLAPGYDPAWSPSGDRIAYALVEEAGPSIRTVNVSNGAFEVLVTAPSGAELAAPAWLPDGRLVYVQDGDLWMLDPAQAGPVQVTSSQGIHRGSNADPLAVSPSSTWVAYTNGSDAGALVELAGVDVRAGQTFPWTGPVTQPAWAPRPTSEPSPLGSSWTPATMPAVAGRPVGRVEAITAGGPGFIAVGRGCVGQTPTCEGAVWTSVDGTAWLRVPTSDALDTGASFPTSGPEIGMFDVETGGNGFVAIGYAARPKMQATAWFSPDATTWTRTPLGSAGSYRVSAVGWDGMTWYIVGEDRSDWDGTAADLATARARAAVWTSPDGQAWTRVPDAPVFDVGGFMDTMEDPSTGGMSDVVAGPAGFVAVGSVCTTTGACEPAAWTTGGGTTWARVADMERLSGRLWSVAATDGGYVAVGSAACDASPDAAEGCPALIMRSTDAQTWRRQAGAPVSDLERVTRIGDRFFASGAYGPNPVWVSPDGETWTALDAASGAPVGAGGTVTDPRLAADNVTAVWLGLTEGGDPAAWVSVAGAAP